MDDIRIVETDENGAPTVLEVLVDGSWHRREIVPETQDRACGNCGTVWPADYGGQCDQCGAAMNTAGKKPALVSGGDVNANLAALSRSASRDGGFGNQADQARRSGGVGGTGHPGVASIKETANPFASEVLEDMFGG